MSSLAVEPLDSEGEPGYAASVWSRLQEFVLKAKSDAMRMQLQKLNPTTDPAYDELFSELVQVDGELRRLRQTTRVRSTGDRDGRVGGAFRSVHWGVVQRTPEEIPLSVPARERESLSLDEVKETITAKGRERGFVTSEDLLEAVPVDDFTPEQVEEFLTQSRTT